MDKRYAECPRCDGAGGTYAPDYRGCVFCGETGRVPRATLAEYLREKRRLWKRSPLRTVAELAVAGDPKAAATLTEVEDTTR